MNPFYRQKTMIFLLVILSDGDVSINQTIIKDLNKKSVGNKKYNISFFSKKIKMLYHLMRMVTHLYIK